MTYCRESRALGDIEVTAQMSSHNPNSFVVHLGILLCFTLTHLHVLSVLAC